MAKSDLALDRLNLVVKHMKVPDGFKLHKFRQPLPGGSGELITWLDWQAEQITHGIDFTEDEVMRWGWDQLISEFQIQVDDAVYAIQDYHKEMEKKDGC